jgi:hypothetical protein
MKFSLPDSMIRILFALSAAAIALVSSSCCCTGESEAPKLPAVPQFQEIETSTPAPPPPPVRYEK